jgi:hypothetical protein
LRIAPTKGNIFKKETIQAPSGKTYNFYGQKIDLDLEIPKKGITNREWMKKGVVFVDLLDFYVLFV